MQLLLSLIQRCVVILIQNKIWCSLFECFCSTELFSWLFYNQHSHRPVVCLYHSVMEWSLPCNWNNKCLIKNNILTVIKLAPVSHAKIYCVTVNVEWRHISKKMCLLSLNVNNAFLTPFLRALTACNSAHFHVFFSLFCCYRNIINYSQVSYDTNYHNLWMNITDAMFQRSSTQR